MWMLSEINWLWYHFALIIASSNLQYLATFSYKLFPDNFFVLRFNNVLEGKDSSFIGRTYDAFYLGWKIAEMKSILFGSGLGQTKVLGLDLWTKYYAYNFTINQIAIPNVIGDTLAVYGLVGVFIRIGLQIYFFFRTTVFNN